MSQHASRSPTRTHRVLLRAGLMAAVAGSALGAGGTAGAAAAEPPNGAANGADLGQIPTALDEVVQGLDVAKRTALGMGLGDLQLDPLAKTGSDPLDNSVGTQINESEPLSTAALTGPLAEGASLSELPTIGPIVSRLLG